MRRILTPQEISLIAVFTAMVAVVTSAFALYTPPTVGFFNIGEIAVYLSALVGGPVVGAIAGGLGSAIADVVLGYTHYAPITFVVKGVEGFLAAYLFGLLMRRRRLKERLVLLPPVYAFLVAIGVLGMNGIRLELGGEAAIVVIIPPELVVAIVVIIAYLITLAVITAVGFAGVAALSCAVAGLEMVFGYFIAETLIYGLPAALCEVPINLLQMTVGVCVAVPVADHLRKAGVRLACEESLR